MSTHHGLLSRVLSDDTLRRWEREDSSDPLFVDPTRVSPLSAQTPAVLGHGRHAPTAEQAALERYSFSAE